MSAGNENATAIRGRSTPRTPGRRKEGDDGQDERGDGAHFDGAGARPLRIIRESGRRGANEAGRHHGKEGSWHSNPNDRPKGGPHAEDSEGRDVHERDNEEAMCFAYSASAAASSASVVTTTPAVDLPLLSLEFLQTDMLQLVKK